MSRLFGFGDSFTKYAWSTWCDILGQTYDETYNYGQHGCDNFSIYSRFITCIIEDEITSDDTVVIQWSEPLRLDFITKENNYWSGLGSGTADLLYQKRLDCFVNNETTFYKSLLMMCSVIKMLEERNINWYFFFINDHAVVYESFKHNCNYENGIEHDFDSLLKYILKFKDRLVSESITDFQHRKGYYKEIKVYEGNKLLFLDTHPVPIVHLEFLEEKLNIKLDNSIRNILLEISKYILTEQKLDHTTIDQKVRNMFEKNNLKISKHWFERYEI